MSRQAYLQLPQLACVIAHAADACLQLLYVSAREPTICSATLPTVGRSDALCLPGDWKLQRGLKKQAQPQGSLPGTDPWLTDTLG